MRHLYVAFFLFTAVVLAGAPVAAQEAEERVIDEVVAQVNDGVITLSRVKREMKGIVDAEVQQGKKREDAEKLIEEKRGELIASMINEELLVQKAKEMNLDKEIDAAVNQRFLEIMKQHNLKTVEALHAEMEKSGVNPQEIRDMWKKQITRELVLQREVQAKVYWGVSGKELKDYYEKHKAKFTKPETVTVSEVFLSFAGRDENAVREKAKQLVAQLRGGADFAKVVADQSDRQDKAQTKGSLGTAPVSQIESTFPKIGAAIKGLKAGSYTEPIDVDVTGVAIYRVDARTAASSESHFDENAVRLAILGERAPEAQKKFMATLRTDSYIKINDAYRPIVAPVLFAEDRKEKAANK